MGVEKYHVKQDTLKAMSPWKPLAATATLAPSSIMAELPEGASQVIGCKVGSMHTCGRLQTSDLP